MDLFDKDDWAQTFVRQWEPPNEHWHHWRPLEIQNSLNSRIHELTQTYYKEGISNVRVYWRTPLFYLSAKKRSRSWRAGCHNGCTCNDSGVVRYWIVCWIGWHFVIMLSSIWNKNDVITIEYDVIIIYVSSIESDPWFSFSFYFYFHWMKSPAYYPLTSFKKDPCWPKNNKIGMIENFPDWLSWSWVDQIRFHHFQIS